MKKFFDWFITAMILLSVIIVFAVTFDLPPMVRKVCIVGEVVASLVFTIEYVVRLWIAEKKLKHIFSLMAIIDLVAILPFYLPMFLPGSLLGIRALRLVRLLRILKLNRYFDALGTIGSVISSKRRELIGSLFFVFLMMLISSLLMYTAEHDAQPEVFRNAASGLWWAVATLTTVGYGDIYPVTNMGRLLGSFIAFSGIAAVAIPTGIITAGLTERIDRTKQAEKDASQDEILKALLEEVRELKKHQEGKK